MRALRYVVVDVFTDTPLAGNQLAVFTDAREVDSELMQALALEMGFSETTFVLPAEQGGTARVRIFTPAVETREISLPSLTKRSVPRWAKIPRVWPIMMPP